MALVWKIPRTVGTAMAARISAGTTVQMISTVVLPCICVRLGVVRLAAEAEHGVEQRAFDQHEDADCPVERVF